MRRHPFIREIVEGVQVGIGRNGEVQVTLALDENEPDSGRVPLSVDPFYQFNEGDYGRIDQPGLTILRSISDPRQAEIRVSDAGRGIAFTRRIDLEFLVPLLMAADDLNLMADAFGALAAHGTDDLHDDLDEVLSDHTSHRRRAA